MAIAAEHHEVGSSLGRVREDGVLHARAAAGDVLDVDIDAVTREMPAHVGAGDLAALIALARDDDDVDRFGALKEGQGVRNGARGWAAAIPADDDAVDLQPLLVGLRNDDQRATRAEQSALDYEFLGGALLAARLPDHREVEPAGDAP